MKTKLAALFFAVLLFVGYARAEDLFFDSAGVRIHYIVEGKGEPVLLIHGFAGDARMIWIERGIVGALAKDYLVIAPDNRGHGLSGKPHDPQAYGPKMAEDAIRLLDFLKVRKAHVVGYSMGGRITVNLLGNHPDRLRSAVVGGAGWMDPKEFDVRRAGMNAIAESLEQGRGIGPLFVMLTPRGEQPPSPAQMGEINKFVLARNDPMALAAVARAMVTLQPPLKKIRANKVPALALVGERDPLREDAERLVSVMPNTTLSVIPGADHMAATRNPEFLKRVQAFLAAHAEKAKAAEARAAR
jgi:pimeloyl-ACP methyl ester carboxylesterase